MKKFLLAFVLAVSAFGVPSCYDIHKIEKPSDSSTQKAVFILIDETTPFNEQLKEQILNNALKFIAPENRIFVGKFSAFLQDRYNQILFDFTLDTPLILAELKFIS